MVAVAQSCEYTKVTKLCALKCCILWYVNYVSTFKKVAQETYKKSIDKLRTSWYENIIAGVVIFSLRSY